MALSTPPTLKDTTKVDLYIVLIVDILNQGQALAQWDSAKNPEELRLALQASVGRVAVIRKAMMACVRPWTVSVADGELPDSTPPLKGVNNSTDITIQCFGDTTLVFGKLFDHDGNYNSKTAYAIMSSGAAAMLTALTESVALRGGIDIGAACDTFPDEIYGPVLKEVYRLESRVAQSPRIVCGDNLRKLALNGMVPSLGIGLEVEPKLAASLLKQYVAIDDDGVAIVDYLGAECAKPFAGNSKVQAGVMKAAKFSDNEWKKAISRRDQKLASRYAQVKRYIEPRLKYWQDSDNAAT